MQSYYSAFLPHFFITSKYLLIFMVFETPEKFKLKFVRVCSVHGSFLISFCSPLASLPNEMCENWNRAKFLRTVSIFLMCGNNYRAYHHQLLIFFPESAEENRHNVYELVHLFVFAAIFELFLNPILIRALPLRSTFSS